MVLSGEFEVEQYSTIIKLYRKIVTQRFIKCGAPPVVDLRPFKRVF
jgi:hypothetical protein